MKIKHKIVAVLLLLIIVSPISVLAEDVPVIAPRLIQHSFIFPEDIIEKHSGETVFMKVALEISDKGTVENIQIIDSSGDREVIFCAVQSIENFKFIPAYWNNQAVSSEVTIPITVTLPDATEKDQ